MNISIHNDWVDIEIYPTDDDMPMGDHTIDIKAAPVLGVIAFFVLCLCIFSIAYVIIK